MISLRDFNPTSVWFTSVGIRRGITVNLKNVIDEDTGESYDVDEPESILPFGLDIMGSVEEGEWCWDGKGNLHDWQNNTVRDIKAFR